MSDSFAFHLDQRGLDTACAHHDTRIIMYAPSHVLSI